MHAGLHGGGSDPTHPAVSVEKAERIVEGWGPGVREVVAEIIRLMGYEATVAASDESGVIRVSVEGENLAGLIGKHGQTLTALEALTAAVAARRLGTPVRVEMDVSGYRQRRVAALEALARRTADRVARTRREVPLSPMNSRDRRVIHVALQDHPSVITTSRGEGELRRVVVMPRGSTLTHADELAAQGNDLKVQDHLRRRPQEVRRSRFQAAGRAARSARKPGGKKPPGQPAGGASARPEGLPVDEELEAEIQAHLERIERKRSALGSLGTAKPSGAGFDGRGEIAAPAESGASADSWRPGDPEGPGSE
jgi:predicted RNA-binding protein Jag